MGKMEILKSLIGKDLKKEDLVNVDYYVHNKLGLFIPSMGQCYYAVKKSHSHPSYMFVIVFDEENCSTKKDHYKGFVISPEIPHDDYFNNNYYCIMIDKNYFEEQYKMYSSEKPYFQWNEFYICSDILKTLNTFAFEYSKNMPNSEITMEAQMTIITHWLIRSLLGETLDMRSISSNFFVAKAEHYMERHFSDKISVKRLSEFVNMSVSSFSRLFKKETGNTPMEYLMDIRYKKAKNMLKRKNVSITEIALKCGFASSSHFSTSFTKNFGITPLEYRKYFFNI